MQSFAKIIVIPHITLLSIHRRGYSITATDLVCVCVCKGVFVFQVYWLKRGLSMRGCMHKCGCSYCEFVHVFSRSNSGWQSFHIVTQSKTTQQFNQCALPRSPWGGITQHSHCFSHCFSPSISLVCCISGCLQ